MAQAADAPAGRLRLGRAVVDLDAEQVIDPEGRTAALRPQAFAVLRHLIANPRRLVTKDALMDAVWPGIAVGDDSLVQCVGEIRRALGDEGRDLVETVPRRGYRLAVAPAPAGAGPRGFGRRGRAALGAALLLAALALGAWRAFGPGDTASHMPAIAVLPFVSMGASMGEGRDYLGPGVAENVIAMLARSQDVAVVARTSSFAWGDRPADVREIGKALGVDYVLEGSVRREGAKLRITAQLEDARTGRHVWAKQFDRAGTDPWALVDQVSGEIIVALVGEGGEVKRALFRRAWGRDAASLGEYDYYLRGLDVYFDAATAEENDRGGAIWAEGLARYPDSAMLKAKLGWYHWTAAWDYWSGDIAHHYAEADRLVSEVLAADDLAPEVQRVAHWLNAFVETRRGDFDAAVREAELTVSMAPYDAHMLRHLANALAASGRYEQALDWLATAQPLEPGDPRAYLMMRAWIRRLMGRDEEALEACAALGEKSAYLHLSCAIPLVRLGRLDEARRAVAAGLRADPGMTQAVWRAGSFYADPAILDGEVAALAEAGLPER